MEQMTLQGPRALEELADWLAARGVRALLLVHDSAFDHLSLAAPLLGALAARGIAVTRFDGFAPNPPYESVLDGIAVYRAAGCGAVLAVGGGSALDVAKCIKLWADRDEGDGYLGQQITPNTIPLAAIPTTAGTGSEATRFAVIYKDGEKQSIADDSILPGITVLDASVLATLPDYQRRATMMDTYCHAIESMWSVHADEASQAIATQALQMAQAHREGYLAGTPEGNEGMLRAANLAGQAINRTQTTAGHAMSYKLTSLFGIAHGHAVALCVPPLWQYTHTHTHMCIDPRGPAYLQAVLARLDDLLGGPEAFAALVAQLGLAAPALSSPEQLDTLVRSVNPVRLGNNPIALGEDALRGLYKQIFAIQ